jgi:hypothetical protein
MSQTDWSAIQMGLAVCACIGVVSHSFDRCYLRACVVSGILVALVSFAQYMVTLGLELFRSPGLLAQALTDTPVYAGAGVSMVVGLPFLAMRRRAR